MLGATASMGMAWHGIDLREAFAVAVEAVTSPCLSLSVSQGRAGHPLKRRVEQSSPASTDLTLPWTLTLTLISFYSLNPQSLPSSPAPPLHLLRINSIPSPCSSVVG
jgi:hypothetical protein